MGFDSTLYWKITWILFMYRLFYVFFLVSPYIYVIVPLFGYIPALNSVRDNGSQIKLMFPALLLDLSLVVLFPLIPIFDFIHFLLLAFFMIMLYLSSVREINVFGRTIQSLNQDERIKARNAMKTMDPKEISKVATYKKWKYL